MNISERFAHDKVVSVHWPDPSNGSCPEYFISANELRTVQEDFRFIIAQTARKKPFIGALAIDFRDDEGMLRMTRFETTRNYDGELSNERDQLRQAISDNFNLVAAVEAAHIFGWIYVPPSKILYTVPKRLNHASSAIIFGSIGDLVITILSTADEQDNDIILSYIKARLLEDRKYERHQEFNW